RLQNRAHYPVIVCASCYTTAFDQAQSIGEALVNQPGAGAIAVIGAPWKATVQESLLFNQHFFRHYFDPAVATIGQASLLAHRDHIPAGQNEALYNSFTLLGDPAVQLIRRGDLATTDVQSTVFQVHGDRIVFPGYDDARPTTSPVLARLDTTSFPGARVYRDRVMLAHDKPILSDPFTMPADATTITITARSRPAGNDFPR